MICLYFVVDWCIIKFDKIVFLDYIKSIEQTKNNKTKYDTRLPNFNASFTSTCRDLIESLAIEFQITDTERKELLASGNQAIFDNRDGWAKTILKKAGLLDSTKRATFTISQIRLDTLGIQQRFNKSFAQDNPI